MVLEEVAKRLLDIFALEERGDNNNTNNTSEAKTGKDANSNSKNTTTNTTPETDSELDTHYTFILHAAQAYTKADANDLLDPEEEPAAALLSSIVHTPLQLRLFVKDFLATQAFHCFVVRTGLEQMRCARNSLAASERTPCAPSAASARGSLKTALETTVDMVELFLLAVRDAAESEMVSIAGSFEADVAKDVAHLQGALTAPVRSFLLEKMAKAVGVMILSDAVVLSRKWLFRCQEGVRAVRKAATAFARLKQMTVNTTAPPLPENSEEIPQLSPRSMKALQESSVQACETQGNGTDQTAQLAKFLAQKQQMHDVRARLATFTSYPMNSSTCNPRSLAEAGFFHAPLPGKTDGVACSGCGLWLCGWEATDVPYEMHQDVDAYQMNNCSFLKNGNVEDAIGADSGGVENAATYDEKEAHPAGVRRASHLLSRSGMGDVSLIFDAQKVADLFESLNPDSTGHVPLEVVKKRWGEFDSYGCPSQNELQRVFDVADSMWYVIGG